MLRNPLNSADWSRPFVITGFSSAALTSIFLWHKKYKTTGLIPVLLAEEPEPAENEAQQPRPLTYREMRFLQFASIQYHGQIYMTPQDFLESVTEEVPRPRIGRIAVVDRDVEQWLRNTPSRRRGNNKLFRKLHEKGIISYTEYLFLLCVLTKPKSGFRIAFNMFDTDGNQIVDKKEFLVLEGVFGNQQPVTSEQISQQITRKDLAPVQDTTLMIHFFGRKGTF